MSVLRFGEPAEILAAIPDMLPHLLVPTLIFQGEHDRAIPQGFAARASGLIPRAELVMVNSGHFIPLSNPETVASELLNFFEGKPFEKQTAAASLNGLSIFSAA